MFRRRVKWVGGDPATVPGLGVACRKACSDPAARGARCLATVNQIGLVSVTFGFHVTHGLEEFDFGSDRQTRITVALKPVSLSARTNVCISLGPGGFTL